MKSREIVIYGYYMAIFLVIGLIPNFGYPEIGPINFTIMALPVTVITVHKGWRGALFGLLMFGITSSIVTFYIPTGALFLANLGILKSVLTSIFGRLLIFLPLSLYLFITKKIGNVNNYLNGFLIALIISVSNTIFVFMFFVLFGWGTFENWFILLGLTNLLPEWLIIPIFAPIFAMIGKEFRKKDENIKKISY